MPRRSRGSAEIARVPRWSDPQEAHATPPRRHPLFDTLARLLVPDIADRCGLWALSDRKAWLQQGDSTVEPPCGPDRGELCLNVPGSGWVHAASVGPGASGRAVAVALGHSGEYVVAERGPEREPFPAEQLQWMADLVGLATRAAEREGLDERLAHARSAADAAAHRWASLARISGLLAGATGEESTLDALLEGVVPYLADWAIVDLTSNPGRGRRHARHVAPDEAGMVEALRGFPFGSDSLSDALERLPPEGIVVSSVADPADPRFVPARERELLQALRPRSFVVVPIRVAGRVAAALTLVSSASGQRYGDSDADLFRQVAGLAGLALTGAAVLAEAEYARREREEVLAIVSHDLKNPLNVLSFATSILGQPGFPDDKVEKQVPVIERAVGHMGELIDSLLDAARIDAGRFSVEPRAQVPSSIVRDALEQMRPLAEQAGIELLDRVPEDLPPIAADRERLVRVFSNLLSNGISYTPAGGTVTVSAHAGHAGEDAVWFEVRDTGEGIEPEVLDRIFDRFWNARRKGKAGAGLGLAIVQGIVSAHGGRIEVESEIGEGATFRFSIPAAAGAVVEETKT